MRDWVIIILLVIIFGWGIVFWPIAILGTIMLVWFIANKIAQERINNRYVIKDPSRFSVWWSNYKKSFQWRTFFKRLAIIVFFMLLVAI